MPPPIFNSSQVSSLEPWPYGNPADRHLTSGPFEPYGPAVSLPPLLPGTEDGGVLSKPPTLFNQVQKMMGLLVAPPQAFNRVQKMEGLLGAPSQPLNQAQKMMGPLMLVAPPTPFNRAQKRWSCWWPPSSVPG